MSTARSKKTAGWGVAAKLPQCNGQRRCCLKCCVTFFLWNIKIKKLISLFKIGVPLQQPILILILMLPVFLEINWNYTPFVLYLWQENDERYTAFALPWWFETSVVSLSRNQTAKRSQGNLAGVDLTMVCWGRCISTKHTTQVIRFVYFLYRFHQYVVTPAAELEVHEISLSVSIGLWGGVLPVPALTTVATLLMAAILQVSSAQKALAFTFNMLATPLQILTMPSFILMGNYLFRDSTCDPLTLLATFRDPNTTFFTAIGNSSACLCAGVVVWAILGVPVVSLLTISLAYLIRTRQEKLALIKIK